MADGKPYKDCGLANFGLAEAGERIENDATVAAAAIINWARGAVRHGVDLPMVVAMIVRVYTAVKFEQELGGGKAIEEQRDAEKREKLS